MKHAELNINFASAFLNAKTLKLSQKNTYVYIVTKIISKSLMKS